MFFSLTHDLVNYLTNNPGYGNLIAFFFAFIESLAIIGSIIPGSVTMTAIGSLIGLNILSFTPVLFWSVIGAIIGDLCSFYIGLHYKDRILNLKIFTKYQTAIAKLESFVKKHGVFSIIIGRFFGPFRSMTPLAAGILNMKTIKFIAGAIPASILWSLVYLGPGIFLGSISADFPGYIPIKIIIYFLISLLTLWLGLKISFYLIIKNKAKINNKLKSIANMELTKRALDQKQITREFRVKYILLGILYSLLFLLCAIGNQLEWVITINESTYSLMQSLWNKPVNYFLFTLTFFADKYTLFSTAIISMLLISKIKNLKTILYWVTYVICAALIIKASKLLCNIDRPPIIAHILGHTSFPSGHVAYITALLCFIWLHTKNTMQQCFTKTVINKICFIAPFLTAISRVYLGAHWLNDIIAGSFIGLSIAYFGYAMLFNKIKIQEQYYKTYLVIIIWLSCAMFFISAHFHDYYKNYFPKNNTITITQHQLKTNNPMISLTRNNRLGYVNHVINIRWLKDIAIIKKTLIKNHWQCSNITTKERLTTWLKATNKNICSMPIDPPRLNNNLPEIIAIKKLNSTNSAVLFIWPSYLQYNKQQLSLGSLYIEQSHKPLVTLKEKQFNVMPLKKLTNSQIIQIKKAKTIPKNINWDHNILLIMQ